MLTTSPVALVRLFFIGLQLGVVLGAAYDCLRITRVFMGIRYTRAKDERVFPLPMPRWARQAGTRKPRHALRDLLVNVEDFLYFLLAGPAVAIYLSEANNGRIRWLAFAGPALGFFLYRSIPGKVVIRFSVLIADGLHFAIAWLCYGISRPFLWLARLIRLLCTRVTCRLRGIWARLYLPIYTRRAMRCTLRRINRLYINLRWGDAG